MGHKTHAIGFRIGVIKGWQATWFAAKPRDYRNLIKEDLQVRKTILDKYPDAGISVILRSGERKGNINQHRYIGEKS